VRDRYLKIKGGRHLKFLSYDDDPYEYLFSDVVITSARSTIEVEASLIRKPMIRIWMPKPEPNETQLSYEYGAMDFDASYLVRDIGKLEEIIVRALGDNKGLNENQRRFIEYLGITFDGKAHDRFLDAICKVGDKK
jgi:hypothetical protein